MAKPKQIKVALTNRGQDVETPWAVDLGPASGPSGSRKVRLINVPFMHAKPTWGDTIVVSPVDDGLPTWDRDGVPWPKIGSRIADDGGRWAMIVDYAPHRNAAAVFEDIARTCAEHDVVCERAWGPRNGEPGRAYLAVSPDLTDHDVMTSLREAQLACELIQIHPESQHRAAAKPATRVNAKPAAAKPAAKTAAKPTAKPAKPATYPARKAPPKRAARSSTKSRAKRR